MTGELSPSRRRLTEPERQRLADEVRDLEARARRTGWAHLPVALGVVSVLWLLTILASDSPWPVVTAFWIVAGGSIAIWVGRSQRADAGQLRAMAKALRSAIVRNEADVYDIRSQRFAELEEVEDEGACYAFQIGDDRMVFVFGQEFYPSGDFPSLDFSLVYVLDEDDRSVDMLIETRAARARPDVRIPRASRHGSDAPTHLEVRSGRIEDLAGALRLQREG